MAQFSLTEIFILSKEPVFGYNVRKAEIVYIIYPENIFNPIDILFYAVSIYDFGVSDLTLRSLTQSQFIVRLLKICLYLSKEISNNSTQIRKKNEPFQVPSNGVDIIMYMFKDNVVEYVIKIKLYVILKWFNFFKYNLII